MANKKRKSIRKPLSAKGQCQLCLLDNAAISKWQQEGGLMPKRQCKGHDALCQSCMKVVSFTSEEGLCQECWDEWVKRKIAEAIKNDPSIGKD